MRRAIWLSCVLLVSLLAGGCVPHAGITGGDRSSWIGGLIGINSGGIAGSHADIHVICGQGGFLAGGLVGLHRGRIVSSSAAGNVSGADKAFHLGGLVGMSLGMIFYRIVYNGS